MAAVSRKKKIAVMAGLTAAVLVLAVTELLVGSSGLSVGECLDALLGRGETTAVRIMRYIRLPRLLAAMIAGAGLSAAGLVMQTVLGNPMASPSTLGVSNAAVFGANLSIIALAGGFLSTGNNLNSYTAGADPFATSALAFVFAAGSVLLVLGLCRLRAFTPNVVVLAGIALGSVWTAATTILQFYATDVGLSAAVIWSFGDPGRATYRADGFMLAVAAAGIAVFAVLAWRYNALLSGGDAAGSMGVNVPLLRWVSLLLASLITAVCVSFLGMIGFVGIICPHAVKRLVGQDHRWALPAAALCGSAPADHFAAVRAGTPANSAASATPMPLSLQRRNTATSSLLCMRTPIRPPRGGPTFRPHPRAVWRRRRGQPCGKIGTSSTASCHYPGPSR